MLKKLLSLLMLGAIVTLVSCDSDDDGLTYGYTDVKGEWKTVQGYIGTLRHDAGLDAWVYDASDLPSGQFDLRQGQHALVTVYNWRDEFATFADGCKIDGYYRVTGVETYADSPDETVYISVRIDHISAYPEPEPVEPDPAELIYRAGHMTIATDGGAPIQTKTDYVDCTISLIHDNDEWNLSDVTAGIRGRGNSTWLWYPKKPYRIKFTKKQSLISLPKAKSWVLLAEYRDPTSLMNTFVFELGNLMGLPYTNHNRYVRLELNGKDQGLYHLTEQVQQNENRVNVDELAGYLIQLDSDDGPDLSPDATDNFWSTVYRMPVCVKNPDEPDQAQLAQVRADLADLETAISRLDYDEIDRLLDIRSMIDFLIVQELIYNVELDAPRSMYMHRDVGGKWFMGPLWDFDAGFDFDWNNMTASHNYFADYRELVLGTNPATHAGTQYRVPAFFSDLFRIGRFVTEYKQRWTEVAPMVSDAMANAMRYYDANADLWAADATLWPIGKSPVREIKNMSAWLDNRTQYLNTVVANYPQP